MEIRIISSEIIKPSSPTPDHLRSYKLSDMDQYTLYKSFSVVYFYSRGCENSHDLKKSLSKTLTYYYPFAGRVKDEFSVECDDYGVTFIEAHVAGCNISELIKQPKMELLELLRPYNEEEILIAQVNLAVKVNYFDCGGVAICLTFRHVIADGCAAVHFVRNWSKVAAANCADGIISKDAIFDRTSIFPSQDDVPEINHKRKPDANDDHVTKWFVFENSNIAVLQEKIGNRSTRFEALLALLWGAIIDAEEESKDKSNPPQCGVLVAVNLRRKLNPPLHDQSIGNEIVIGMTAWPTKERAKYDKIVSKYRELISMVDEYVKNGFRNGRKTIIINHAALEENISNTKMINFNAVIKLPFYETDFGWGKPVWFTPAQRPKSSTFSLSDTSDGKGLQVVVHLSKEDMAKFEQHPAILAYAS